ncbi:MAG: carbohydrate kinase, partial [Clostridia bacterium]|nr:carbohydrate kinase [Clostridia bacterium]
MQRERLEELLNRLKDIRIAVVGDFFLDRYFMIDSSLNEKSLETDLIAYQVTEKRLFPGAAGTVTNNLAALGVGKIYAVGVIGSDGEGFELTRELNNRGVDTSYLVQDERIFTPTYTKPVIKSEMRELSRLDIRNRA